MEAFPQQPMGKGGCRVRREERDEATQPEAGSQECSREPPHPGPTEDPTEMEDVMPPAGARSQSLPMGSFLQRKSCYVRTGGGQSFAILPLCHNEPRVIGPAREEHFGDLDPPLGHPHRGAFLPPLHLWQAGLRFPFCRCRG